MKLKYYVHLLFLVNIFVFLFQIVEPKVSIKFKFLNCFTTDDEIFVIKKCSIKPVSRTSSVVEMLLAMTSTLRKFTLDLQFLKKMNGWHPYLYHVSFDGCEFARHPYNPLVAKFAYDEIKNYTNLARGCPYEKGTETYLNYTMPKEAHIASLLKRFPIETGEYGFVLKMLIKNKLRASFNASLIYSDYSKLN